MRRRFTTGRNRGSVVTFVAAVLVIAAALALVLLFAALPASAAQAASVKDSVGIGAELPRAAGVARAPLDEGSLEIRLFRLLNGKIANPVFDALMPFLTNFKRWRVFALAAWLVLIVLGGSKGRWAALLLIPLVAASDQLTSSVIKPLVARPRPCELLAGVHFWREGSHWIWTPPEVLGGFKTSFGFPSSHASNLTASMLFLSLAYKRWVPYVCLPFAGLVCLSRIYTGVHWPSDVLAGIAIGAGLALLAYYALKRIAGRDARDTSRTRRRACDAP